MNLEGAIVFDSERRVGVRERMVKSRRSNSRLINVLSKAGDEVWTGYEI